MWGMPSTPPADCPWFLWVGWDPVLQTPPSKPFTKQQTVTLWEEHDPTQSRVTPEAQTGPDVGTEVHRRLCFSFLNSGRDCPTHRDLVSAALGSVASHLDSWGVCMVLRTPSLSPFLGPTVEWTFSRAESQLLMETVRSQSASQSSLGLTSGVRVGEETQQGRVQALLCLGSWFKPQHHMGKSVTMEGALVLYGLFISLTWSSEITHSDDTL